MGVTVLLALAAALAWGVTSYASAPAARDAGVRCALAWSALIAPAVLWPIALLLTGAPDPAGWDLAWAGIFGLGLIGALGLGFLAMTLGRVSIVATVISTDGAMAAAVSIARGETVGGLLLAGLTVIVVGVLLAVSGGGQSQAGPRRDGLAALAAVGSAACFATTFLERGRGRLPATGLARRPRAPRAARPRHPARARGDAPRAAAASAPGPGSRSTRSGTCSASPPTRVPPGTTSRSPPSSPPSTPSSPSCSASSCWGTAAPPPVGGHRRRARRHRDRRGRG